MSQTAAPCHKITRLMAPSAVHIETVRILKARDMTRHLLVWTGSFFSSLCCNGPSVNLVSDAGCVGQTLR